MTTDTSLHKRVLLALIAILVMSGAFLLVSSNTALASTGGDIPDLEIDGSDSNGGGDSGSSDGDSGDTVTPPKPNPCAADPEYCIRYGKGVWSQVNGRFAEIEYGIPYNFTSSVRTTCGEDVAGANVLWHTRLVFLPEEGILVNDTNNFYIRGIDCIDFDRYEITRACVTGSDASIDMRVPATRNIRQVSDDSGFLSSSRSLEACNNAETYVYVNASLPDFGRYLATANTYRINTVYDVEHDPVLNTTEYEYSHTTGSAYTANTRTARLQVYCDGYSYNWDGAHSWDYTECGNDPNGGDSSSNPTYVCRADSSVPDVTINGQNRASATVFRNGEANEITWDVFEPQGNFTATTQGTTQWYRGENSSPWRENGVSINKANFILSRSGTNPSQLLTSATSSSVQSGVQDTAYGYGYWASSEGSPTTIYPRWRWNGYSTVTTIRVDGFDGTNFTTSTSTRNIEAMASCTGDTASLNFVRAVSGPGS